jgi:hypothetical protein
MLLLTTALVPAAALAQEVPSGPITETAPNADESANEPPLEISAPGAARAIRRSMSRRSSSPAGTFPM